MDVCAVFFDLKKAFDSVSHRLLLLKLSSLGIDLYLVQWIAIAISVKGSRQSVLRGVLLAIYLCSQVYHKGPS